MQVIKKILLILYILILGFIVFCNTSVFAEDVSVYTESNQRAPNYVSSAFDSYFINVQDEFDYYMTTSDRSGFLQAKSKIDSLSYNGNYTYYVERGEPGPSNLPSNQKRGFTIWVYNISQPINQLTFNEDFTFAQYDDINGWSQYNMPFHFPVVKVSSWYKFIVYNNGNNYQLINDGVGEDLNLPFCVLNYYHPILKDSYISNTSGAQLTSAINNQTNTLKEETQKQTNAVVSATQSQTNEFLDTNNTGNDTMSVNDTTTDTSADLTGIYNSITSAFTDDSVQQPKSFEMTLPNGDSFTFGLSASILTSFLNKYPVLKAFYQAFFYVVFCGYVIFDFKRIINKLKEGDIDNVVGSSNPVDSVVNMSLK